MMQRYQYYGVTAYCLLYSIFRTRKGYIGLSELHVKLGDEVVVLSRASVPFAARKIKESMSFWENGKRRESSLFVIHPNDALATFMA
jgi:hypothetical protein